MRCALILFSLFAIALAPLGAQAPKVAVPLAKVESRVLEKNNSLPGELQPYQVVDIYAKVNGFVNTVEVDRASWVKAGHLLATLTAPELLAQRAEGEARVQSIESQRIEAAAKLAAAESTYERLKAAAATPGVVAGNDVVLAQKAAEAEKARAEALESTSRAAQESVRMLKEMEVYLRIEAPFDGVITERHAHVGSLVGPASSGSRPPMLRIQEVSRLRLVVPVPEADTESVIVGTRVSFTVPAYPGATFSGVVRRPAFAVDHKTRTMPVELDVDNSARKLAPGMFAEVLWPVRRRAASLFVPFSAVVTTTERIFVIRVRDGAAEWVDVRRGASTADQVEVFGDLKPGDVVVQRGTDEIRPGTAVASASNQK